MRVLMQNENWRGYCEGEHHRHLHRKQLPSCELTNQCILFYSDKLPDDHPAKPKVSTCILLIWHFAFCMRSCCQPVPNLVLVSLTTGILRKGNGKSKRLTGGRGCCIGRYQSWNSGRLRLCRIFLYQALVTDTSNLPSCIRISGALSKLHQFVIR